MPELTEIPRARVRVLRAFSDNYYFLLWREGAERCIVIDPPEEKLVLDALNDERLSLGAIINTHHHSDHVGGNLALKRRFEVPVYCSAVDLARIPGATHALHEGETLHAAGLAVQIHAMPGHTQGLIALEVANCRMKEADDAATFPALFVGDAVFAMGCGRLFEGTAEQSWKSLSKLFAMNQETRLFFAHEYTEKNAAFAKTVDPDNPLIEARLQAVQSALTANQIPRPPTIQEERLSNPFLRCDDPSFRIRLKLPAETSDTEVFRHLRGLRDHF